MPIIVALLAPLALIVRLVRPARGLHAAPRWVVAADRPVAPAPEQQRKPLASVHYLDDYARRFARGRAAA
ncbi:hypothetical protein EKD16_24210 [Streptomonospora litoralis]|uniref:Uncharacterized protein n=1 Tax=Streptomonospora litoralis TaxID=2498135 RepID=A0A4P6QB43_9ACTN|nr:hypothetical protein EKD16_24210 [Streptomonospora litoralis]